VDTTGGFVTYPVSVTPSGAVMFFAMQTPPTGWLECNGASVSTATYPDLFASIGYTYGGAGASFNLPDLRGQFVRGWDNGAGVDPARVFGSNQGQAYLNHTHTINDPGHVHTFYNIPGPGGPPSWFPGSNTGGFVQTDPAVTGITVNTSTTGGNETRPVNVALMACIKYTNF